MYRCLVGVRLSTLNAYKMFAMCCSPWHLSDIYCLIDLPLVSALYRKQSDIGQIDKAKDVCVRFYDD